MLYNLILLSIFHAANYRTVKQVNYCETECFNICRALEKGDGSCNVQHIYSSAARLYFSTSAIFGGPLTQVKLIVWHINTV